MRRRIAQWVTHLWQRSGQRDRRAVLALLVFALVASGYHWVWQPLAGWHREAKDRYRVELSRWDLLQEHAPAIKLKQPVGIVKAEPSIVREEMQAEAVRLGISLVLEDSSEREISGRISSGEFSKTFAWLQSTRYLYGLELQTLIVERATPSTVDVTFVLNWGY